VSAPAHAAEGKLPRPKTIKNPSRPVIGITRTMAIMYEVETQVISSMVAPTVPRLGERHVHDQRG
jgi:hypothetical protein